MPRRCFLFSHVWFFYYSFSHNIVFFPWFSYWMPSNILRRYMLWANIHVQKNPLEQNKCRFFLMSFIVVILLKIVGKSFLAAYWGIEAIVNDNKIMKCQGTNKWKLNANIRFFGLILPCCKQCWSLKWLLSHRLESGKSIEDLKLLKKYFLDSMAMSRIYFLIK